VNADSLIRYAAPGQRTSHLLPSSWPEDRRRRNSRPAHCGTWSTRWRNVEFIAGGAALTLCGGCADAVGIRPAPPRPLDIAPVAGHRVVDGYVVPTAVAELADPQQAHALIDHTHRILRGPFLASIRVPDLTDH
jgi:hypothetical protein